VARKGNLASSPSKYGSPPVIWSPRTVAHVTITRLVQTHIINISNPWQHLAGPFLSRNLGEGHSTPTTTLLTVFSAVRHASNFYALSPGLISPNFRQVSTLRSLSHSGSLSFGKQANALYVSPPLLPYSRADLPLLTNDQVSPNYLVDTYFAWPSERIHEHTSSPSNLDTFLVYPSGYTPRGVPVQPVATCFSSFQSSRTTSLPTEASTFPGVIVSPMT
jgi:hypothetical protein